MDEIGVRHDSCYSAYGRTLRLAIFCVQTETIGASVRVARPRLHDAWALCTARPLLIAAITLPLAVFVAAGAFDFRAEKQQVRHQALATATALAEHAQTVVETTELVLARVLDRVAGMDWAMIPSSPALHDFLMKLREDLPQIDSVFLVSPEGENVASILDGRTRLLQGGSRRKLWPIRQHAFPGPVGSGFNLHPDPSSRLERCV